MSKGKPSAATAADKGKPAATDKPKPAAIDKVTPTPAAKAKLTAADKGIPAIDALGVIKFLPMLMLGPVVSSGVGACAAWYIYTHGNRTLYDKSIERLVETEQGWTLLAAAVFNLAVNCQQTRSL